MRIKQVIEKKEIVQKIIVLFFIFYFSLLFYVVFLARRRRLESPEYYKLHLTPFKNVFRFYSATVTYTSKEYYEFYINLLGNIAMFIPLPFFLVNILGVGSNKKCIYIAAGLSIIIELVQYLFSIGVADIDDVILNTVGSIIGLLMMRHLIPNLFQKIMAK